MYRKIKKKNISVGKILRTQGYSRTKGDEGPEECR